MPTSAELVRVITSAADAVGLKFDDGIIEDLAQDVAGDPASLPTLQFTLSRLWAALPTDSNRITRDLYRQVGKPRVALARAAEAAFERLTAEEQAIAQRQFLELVQPTIGGDVRRRRIPLDNLVQLTGDSATQIAAVLKRFEQAELVRRTKSFEAGDDRYEVAHEALVNNWKRLDDWLKVKRQESEKKLQLITAARLWRESGQSPGYLLTGDAIKDAMRSDCTERGKRAPLLVDTRAYRNGACGRYRGHHYPLSRDVVKQNGTPEGLRRTRQDNSDIGRPRRRC
jgi:hypothetical protein